MDTDRAGQYRLCVKGDYHNDRMVVSRNNMLLNLFDEYISEVGPRFYSLRIDLYRGTMITEHTDGVYTKYALHVEKDDKPYPLSQEELERLQAMIDLWTS